MQKLGNYEVIRKTEFIRELFRINKPKVITDRTKSQALVLNRIKLLNVRVRSWLRMNAGGVPNTCKSNGDLTLMKLRQILVKS